MVCPATPESENGQQHNRQSFIYRYTPQPPPPRTPLTQPPPGYLHLAYFATEITLHRCIIRSLTTPPTSTYLSHICRSAAKTRLISAMDFVNRLRLPHLHSFWYFPSRVNFALIATFGCLLLATAPHREEVAFYRTRLAEYRWTLRVSCKRAAFLTFAADSLDASELLLRGLPERPSMTEAGAETVDEAMLDGSGVRSSPFARGGAESGLVSPATSEESAEEAYEAYVEDFENGTGGL